MLVNLCPACRRVNAVDARHCQGCGACLDDEPDTQPPPSATRTSASAIWLDELASRPGEAPPAPARPATVEPALSLTLLDVNAEPAVEPAAPAEQHGPDFEHFVLSDPEPRPAVIFPEIESPASADPRKAGPGGRKGKAERRAAVRRNRLRGRKAKVAEPAETEVLVCDANDADRETLGNLLRGFGFTVHAASSAEAALQLLESRRFVAAFVDVALEGGDDGGAGVQLCRKRRELDQRRGVHTLLVLARASLQPTDRVRAQMAGCDEILVKPVTRGSLAGALDSHGVVLPNDPRKG